jgi:isoquinoline 1-oxidoreductase beta subunit
VRHLSAHPPRNQAGRRRNSAQGAIVSGPRTISRRRFLELSGGATGGLILGFHLPHLSMGGRLAQAAAGTPPLNAWLRVAADDSVTVLVAASEMGQGVYTAMPMLVAEELEVDWARVRAEMAPVDPAYNNRIFGAQATGGSTSVRQGFDHLREAGARAREMLRQAAANRWGAPLEACAAENGRVVHRETGRSLRYGELASEAAQLEPPASVALKDLGSWSILGKSRPRLDTPEKSNGRAIFGADVRVPGMLFAMVAACPVLGGRLASVDPAPALRVPGVKAVVPTERAVIVVADATWNAHKGLLALQPDWDEGPLAALDSAMIREQLRGALDSEAVRAHALGDADAAFEAAAAQHEAVYEVPFLAHATMEPMNATAHVRGDGADVWAPTQSQTATQHDVAALLGLAPERVAVHTTFLGGGFGRRFERDFVLYAAAASKAVGAPVQVFWSREEDMRHDFYRPASTVRMRAALDESGRPTAFHARVACPSILARVFPDRVTEGVDHTAVEGLDALPYAIPHQLVEYAQVDTGVPVGFWRSVGNSQNAFFLETFVEELARRAGADPLEFRLALLSERPRHSAVLRVATEMAGWGRSKPGRHSGLAMCELYDSIVAQVADVSVESNRVRVHEVYCAIDCGFVVNPDTVVAQMESAILFGLTAALMGEITISKGRVQQRNFTDYRLLTLASSPSIHVEIVPSANAPGGVGESGTPPIAPAVANAVLAATGKPVRSLPIRL